MTAAVEDEEESEPVDLRSMEFRVAELPPEEREAALDGLDARALQWSWRFKARVDQLVATDSKAPTVLFVGGRGTGKSRTGSEFVRDKIDHKPPGMKLRFALCSRTSADVRDTIINGESGLMTVFPDHQKPAWIGHLRIVRFYDGSEGLAFSSREPDQLRGPQFHYGYADELAAWDWKKDDSGLTAWDNLQIATRLGEAPQVFASTTPRRVPAIRDLYDRAKKGNRVQLITGASTFDNPYLSATYLETMLGLYQGTRLSAQELYGILLGDVDGALWKLEDIEERRLDTHPLDLPLIVIGVDPSVSEKPRDECGIVVAGATRHKSAYRRHGYVLADFTVHGPPSVWAKAVVKAAHTYRCPVVAERNQGGALIKEVIHGIDPTIRIRTVHARQGKALRAEPITLAYDQGRVHHVGRFTALEDQMTSWVPEDDEGRGKGYSPDRVDALVYALSALVVPSSYKAGVGITTARAARGRIDLGGIAPRRPGLVQSGP